ncbi:MAG TPA: hypothetical protein VGH22_20780 [Candidatus Binatia bacterium]
MTLKTLLLILAGIMMGVPLGWFLRERASPQINALLPAKGSAYTSLSNEELKDRSAQLVAAIRVLARSFYEEDNRMRMAADQKTAGVKSQAEQERIRKGWIEDSARLHDTFMQRYKDKFWADAVLLRQAIIGRVGAVPGAQNAILFEQPTNILGVEQVANSLELLEKSLPKTAQNNNPGSS